MKIAVLLATSGIPAAGQVDRKRYLHAIVAPGTQIELISIPDTPPAVESAWESLRAGVGVAAQIVEVERAGFDAAVIWCGDDSGLEAARERVRIPVIGPLDAALSLARQLGRRFSIITAPASESHVRLKVQEAMLTSQLASVEIIDTPVLALRNDLSQTRTALSRAANAGQAAGADVFVIGGMALYGLGRALSRALGAPLIDPGETAILTAEMLVRMGLSHSKEAFPYPVRGE